MANVNHHKTGILLAAYGTASPQGENALRQFTRLIQELFVKIPVRWAFTSSTMRERLANNAHKKSDSIEKALRKMAYEHFTHVAVQPLHMAAGFEYEDVQESCKASESLFSSLAVGKPLLTNPDRFHELAQALLKEIPSERASDDVILFAGHGSKHPSTSLLTDFGNALHACDSLALTAMMKGGVGLNDIIPILHSTKTHRVWLLPLLAVAGRHILSDLCGAKPDSWRSQIEASGLSCIPVMRGLVEYPPCASVWADNLAEALKNLHA